MFFEIFIDGWSRGTKPIHVLAQDLKYLSGEDKLTLYKWNSSFIEHKFCKTCGIECAYCMKYPKDNKWHGPELAIVPNFGKL